MANVDANVNLVDLPAIRSLIERAAADRERVLQELEAARQALEGAFRAGYAAGAADERVNPDFAWAIYQGRTTSEDTP